MSLRNAIVVFVTMLAGCVRSFPDASLPARIGEDERPAKAGYQKAGYQMVYSFIGSPSGSGPTALLSSGGLLYGTTTTGGKKTLGTVFVRRSSGDVRFLHSFRGGVDGAQPEGQLLAVNGTLYGTTAFGGSANDGTVFAIDPSGAERTVYAFKGGSDGANPALVGLAVVGGKLYGTTSAGGNSACRVQGAVGCGTVFELALSGKERVLHRFGGKAKKDGAAPSGPLLAVRSTLYGTTNFGGASDGGTVFAIVTSGSERILYAFRGYPDGATPYAGVIKMNGAFYGTTAFGGAFNSSGTVFEVSASGTERALHSFRGFPDGAVPFAPLTAAGGELVGTTRLGGSATHACVGGPYSGCGTIFTIGTSGDEHVLYRFKGQPDGADPWAGVVSHAGVLYGTALSGGAGNQGSIFRISGLRP